MSEAGLVKKTMARLTKEGGLWIKVSAGPFQVAGLPDIIGCYNGRFYGLEAKLPGKERTLTKIQQWWISEINTTGGGKATMFTTVEQAVEFVYGKADRQDSKRAKPVSRGSKKLGRVKRGS